MPELDDATRAFLEAPGRFATIATIDPDGSPLQAVVWYRLEPDGSILINSLVGRRWPDNLLRDPRMSLTVEFGYDYVAMRGEAETSTKGTRQSTTSWPSRRATRRARSTSVGRVASGRSRASRSCSGPEPCWSTTEPGRRGWPRVDGSRSSPAATAAPS